MSWSVAGNAYSNAAFLSPQLHLLPLFPSVPFLFILRYSSPIPLNVPFTPPTPLYFLSTLPFSSYLQSHPTPNSTVVYKYLFLYSQNTLGGISYMWNNLTYQFTNIKRVLNKTQIFI